MIDKSLLSRMTLNATALLREMVATPSFSGNEKRVSTLIASRLEREGIKMNRAKNNLWALLYDLNPTKPILLLNSHMDTVRPSSSYTFDPYSPNYDESVVRGLGSNDAGASVVTLIETFLHFRNLDLPFNILLAISAEEENSGSDGMKLLYPLLPTVCCAIVGEPTRMSAAIAEKGLLVIDAVAKGVSGHAAREEGVNAITIAHEDITKILSYKFERISPLMGEVKLTVTAIQAGSEHNVVPDRCSYTLDIRPNELYSNEEIFDILKKMLQSELTARSFGNKCSNTPQDHELVNCAKRCDVPLYVSPTTSDWIRIPVPAVKMGPGDSSRSHKADEFVTVEELSGGISGYVKFIHNLKLER